MPASSLQAVNQCLEDGSRVIDSSHVVRQSDMTEALLGAIEAEERPTFGKI